MHKKVRCAIYTRKSSDDGLEQAFNSLDAQREACTAFVQSQKAEGWILLPATYDDGGLSGGTLERPGMQRLLADVDAGLVDQIVVYKIDRLTRSLADFAKIVERLDKAGASFVSVTQSFNTATSMGRLTLNMLLSFAQFEREITAERIRDKIAASKRKGLWMGGYVPLGYDADGRTLKIAEAEATTVRRIYDLYRQHGTIRAVREATEREGLRSKQRIGSDGRIKGGLPFSRGHLYAILTNPIYAGRIRHKRDVHPGQHPAIIPSAEWDAIQRQLAADAARPRRIAVQRGDASTADAQADGLSSPTAASSSARSQGCAPGAASTSSLLIGKIFDETGDRLTPSHTRTKAGQRLRYYVSHRLIRQSGERGITGWRLPGPALEDSVVSLVHAQLASPGFAVRLLAEPTADAIAAASAAIGALVSAEGDAQRDQSGAFSSVQTPIQSPFEHAFKERLASLINRIDIAPGQIVVTLDGNALAKALSIRSDDGQDDALRIAAPFQTRKRGVETKLQFGTTTISRDPTLMGNIAKGHAWFAMIKAGKSVEAIAAETGTPKRRVLQLVDLAFLAPDITVAILDGRQPVGLTSDILIKRGFPSDWDAQRKMLASL